jgi:oleate hydratase
MSRLQTGKGQAHIVGGGIAGLAAAVLLIRDAGWTPENIHLYEGLDVLGGSLDGSGDLEQGFVIRGGRMFEEHFGCTFDLLRTIPTLDDPGLSVADEILAFAESVRTSSNCRLVADGERLEAPEFGLSLKDRWALLKLSRRREADLAGMTIEEWFSPEFFRTSFWIMWCTMFAFQRWHSAAEMRRYMRRFMHLLPGFNRLEGILRTRLNQYDSLVEPIHRWLLQAGVRFHLSAPVTDVEFTGDQSAVRKIAFAQESELGPVMVSRDDLVLITLGSMTEGSTLGDMNRPPIRGAQTPHGAWALWRRLASRQSNFGRPRTFAGNPDATRWLSFTVTLRDTEFFEFMEAFTHNPAGTGGLVTLKNSGWLLSVVLAHQPHFANQPDGATVFWGYGLHPDQPGDRVRKPMLECTGAEILEELAHHLHLGSEAARLFETANCIPCLMPYITAQFMPRAPGDRPAVVPAGAKNYGFLGQFVEMADDTVFTVEYSVRSAQEAVYRLCAPERQPIPLYRGFEKPDVVLQAAACIARNGSV